MPKFIMDETIHSEKVVTARLGTTTNRFNDADKDKAIKLTADSAYTLAADGDEIEGFVSSISTGGTYDGFTLGGVVSTGYKKVQAEGTVAVGDYVVAGTPTALNSPLVGKQKVKKAADQAVAKAGAFPWRVVSLGEAGTGASGTLVLIERV